MGLDCLLEHLGRYCSLTDAERAAINALDGGARHHRRGSILRRENEASTDLYVVESGWLFCSASLEDGRRQIIRFHFRGDMMGCDMLCYDKAPDTVTALTDVDLCMIDRAAFGRMFLEQPRIGALFYTTVQIERVMMMDRLTSLGRSSASGRVAALLLWIEERLRAVNPGTENGFTLPMTQEEIGDAAGLTGVHVNRTLRVLEEQGLIERTRNTLRILDPERLARVANHVPRRPRIDRSWLPAPR